jgi:hypothetical protein
MLAPDELIRVASDCGSAKRDDNSVAYDFAPCDRTRPDGIPRVGRLQATRTASTLVVRMFQVVGRRNLAPGVQSGCMRVARVCLCRTHTR